MQKLILLSVLFTLFNFPCFAQEKTPSIQGFSLDMSIEDAEKNCTSLKNSTWEKLPNQSNYVSISYRCKASLNDGYLNVTLVFIKNNIHTLTLETTNKSICSKIKTRLQKQNPSCFIDKTYWGYCGEDWLMNCAYIPEEKVNVIMLFPRKIEINAY